MKISEKVNGLDWSGLQDAVNTKGFGIAYGFLTSDACDCFSEQYESEDLYRKTISMERYRFGLGQYKYFNYPLPEIISEIRSDMYPHLAQLANRWMKTLNLENRFPPDFETFRTLCHTNGQTKPTPLILKYGKGGYNTLHQDIYGEVYFPLQIVIFLSEPETDYTGGEFVLLEQVPRAQSKAIVIKPQKGDMLIFTTHFRPVAGKKGYYRVNMKHGVSEVHSGARFTLGVIFHDALS